MADLYKLMVAVSTIEVDHDGYGGTAADAVVWDNGSIVKPHFRFKGHRGPCFSRPTLGVVCLILPSHKKMSLSVSTSSSSSLLSWPLCIDLRVLLIFRKFGISYFGPPIMFEQSAGHRFVKKLPASTSRHADASLVPLTLPVMAMTFDEGAIVYMGHFDLQVISPVASPELFPASQGPF